MKRQEQILLNLKKFDYLSTRQILQLNNLKSIGNAQRVMRQMRPFVNSFYDGQNIYYLNDLGRERVNCNVIRKRISTAQHYLMRNDLYIHLNQPSNWKNEIRMISGQDKNKITVVADAHFIHNNKHHIIEIDHTQKMKKNRAKIDKYRRLIERNSFNGMPTIHFVTTTAYRREMLLELCEGLDCKIYLREDFR